MRFRNLAVKLPSDIWDADGGALVERLRGVFEVYLNHEDSDFPFKAFDDAGCSLDRDHEVRVEVVEYSEHGGKLTLMLLLSFFLKSSADLGATIPLRQSERSVIFDIDVRRGAVDAIV